MKLITKTLSIITLSVFSASLSIAELNESAIEKWIQAYPSVDTWMKEHEAIMDSIVDEEAMNGMSIEEMMRAGFDAMKSHPIYKDFEKLVEPFGYEDGEALVGDTIQIMKTFGAISMKRGMAEEGGFDMSQIQKQIDDIDEMEGMSAQQKQMMKQQLQAVMTQVTTMMKSFESVTDADIDVLTPFYDQIASIMEENETSE